jgi:hypothetical protein
MNSKRKADLQRKLSMGAVPRPPAGLAERIKNDIPHYLQAEPERHRFSRSVAFSMRIAASILLLITSVFVTLNLLEPDAKQNLAHDKRANLTPAVMHMEQAKKDATASAAPAEEIRLEMTEEIPVPKKIPPPPSVPRVQLADGFSGARARQETDETDRDLGSANSSAPMMMKAEAPPAAPVVVESEAVVAQAPAFAGYSYDTPAPAAAPMPASSEERRDKRAASSSFVREAYADGLDLGAKKNVFGITVDPNVFYRIKTSLENGTRPKQESVNVEALVNFFAGTPEHPPRRGVRLEVEASPAPIELEGDHAVLRFTIDTPLLETHAGESTPPVARDARVEVDFNGSVVSTYRRVGDADQVDPEAVLLYNVSVTALYDIELRSGLKSSQRIATVRLRYRSIADGREHTIERIVRGRDLAGNWARASRRHRLASLGAIWGESLQGTPQSPDVARRAEELVSQNPKDPLARELAHAASASGGER